MPSVTILIYELSALGFILMIPRKFEYFAPSSMKEALDLLKKFGPRAKILAGGASLIPVMKLRFGSPEVIVDINRLPGMEYVKVSGGRLRIGALSHHGDIQHNSLVIQNTPLLVETACTIGDPQVRNMGTIGGSLSHCDPSGDWGAAITAMRGEVTMRGPAKQRRMKIDDFLVDTFTTALKANEILTEVSVPVPPPGSGGAYLKLERSMGDFATAAVAAQITLDAKGAFAKVGIGLTALGPKNLRAVRAEKILLGNLPTAQTIQEAADAAAEDSQPTADPLRGSADYKREIARVYARRALERAVARAKGGKS